VVGIPRGHHAGLIERRSPIIGDDRSGAPGNLKVLLQTAAKPKSAAQMRQAELDRFARATGHHDHAVGTLAAISSIFGPEHAT